MQGRITALARPTGAKRSMEFPMVGVVKGSASINPKQEIVLVSFRCLFPSSSSVPAHGNPKNLSLPIIYLNPQKAALVRVKREHRSACGDPFLFFIVEYLHS